MDEDVTILDVVVVVQRHARTHTHMHACTRICALCNLSPRSKTAVPQQGIEKTVKAGVDITIYIYSID